MTQALALLAMAGGGILIYSGARDKHPGRVIRRALTRGR